MTTPPNPEDFAVAEPLVMFFVGRYVGSDLSKVYPADVYAAVRGWWRVADPNTWKQEYNLVLARNTDRVLGAFRPKDWVPSPFEGGGWGFVGQPAEVSVQLHYVGKRVPNRYRIQNPFQFLTPEG